MAFRGVPEVCRDVGIDYVDAAVEVGIPLVALADRSLMVSAKATMNFANTLGARSKAAGFGLWLAQRRGLSDFGVAGLAARDQPDLKRFLEVIAKSYVLRFRRCCGRLLDLGDVYELRLSMAEYSAHEVAEVSEAMVGTLVRIVRDMFGDQWAPAYVVFRHSARGSGTLYRHLLGVDPVFERDCVAIGFDARGIGASLPGASPEFRRIAEAMVDQQLARVTDDLADVVLHNLPALIQSGEYAASQVAAACGLSPKGLQRRLAGEETSLPKLVEKVRISLAQKLIEEGELPIVEVSSQLGFGSQVAFAHWHKSKYGVSALHRRKAHSLVGAMMNAEAWG